MNYIDVIEGAAKSIITQFLQMFTEDGLDDTEYARNVKAVINGMDFFILKNREIIDDPKMLKQVLYDFSKKLWIENLEKNQNDPDDFQHKKTITENDRYNEYYFDYIYNHGEYPRWSSGCYKTGAFAWILKYEGDPDMNHMDDFAIKAEIDKISERIDRIIKKLDTAAPVEESEEDGIELSPMGQNK